MYCKFDLQLGFTIPATHFSKDVISTITDLSQAAPFEINPGRENDFFTFQRAN